MRSLLKDTSGEETNPALEDRRCSHGLTTAGPSSVAHWSLSVDALGGSQSSSRANSANGMSSVFFYPKQINVIDSSITGFQTPFTRH